MINPFQAIDDRLDRIESLIIKALKVPVIKNKEDKPLATRKQAAEFLGISISTVINLEKSNQLKPIRIGKSVRHDWDQLNDFKESKTK